MISTNQITVSRLGSAVGVAAGWGRGARASSCLAVQCRNSGPQRIPQPGMGWDGVHSLIPLSLHSSHYRVIHPSPALISSFVSVILRLRHFDSSEPSWGECHLSVGIMKTLKWFYLMLSSSSQSWSTGETLLLNPTHPLSYTEWPGAWVSGSNSKPGCRP